MKTAIKSTVQDGCEAAEQYMRGVVIQCGKDSDAYMGKCRALSFAYSKQDYPMNKGGAFQKGWKATLKKIAAQLKQELSK